MNAETILIVDDEVNIIQLVKMYFEREGFKILTAGDGMTALKSVKENHPALMVLDVMLPGMDGFEVCKKIRAENNNLPVLMLTARDEDIDKILGLELGADDYLTKPFNPRELVARVKAILRRATPVENQEMGIIRFSDIEFDPSRREVRVDAELISLRTQEFEVLSVLLHHQGLVLTREQLLSKAWGFDFAGETRTVDVHIAQLRQKLSKSKVKIETITGVGYKLVN